MCQKYDLKITGLLPNCYEIVTFSKAMGTTFVHSLLYCSQYLTGACRKFTEFFKSYLLPPFYSPPLALRASLQPEIWCLSLQLQYTTKFLPLKKRNAGNPAFQIEEKIGGF